MKELIFYSIAGTVIGLIAQLAGASFTVILLTSLLIPPVILLIFRILRY
ncbi:MAG: hypothetical protein Q7J73_07005 [Dehalococcoidales bacterium]|nr:hypothetical protein [Dehalococcoidales bacterium]